MSVDAQLVPTVMLSNGDRMPCVGLGTFGSDKYRPAEVATAVLEAVEVGYRHFDCASIYGNEAEIGKSFSQILRQGLDRKQLWITSKVWNDCHDQVEASCERSLRDLGLDYLDLFLVHWPFPNSHAPGVDVSSRDPHAVPFELDRYLKTWNQMERLVDRGLVRHIGTSNMTISKLEGLLSSATIKPAANEMEIHPHFQQKEALLLGSRAWHRADWLLPDRFSKSPGTRPNRRRYGGYRGSGDRFSGAKIRGSPGRCLRDVASPKGFGTHSLFR